MSNNGHLTQCSWIKSRKSMDKISSCRPLLDMSANDNCRALYIIVCSSICFKVTFFVLVLVQNYRSHWNLLKTLSAHRLELDFWEFHIFFHDHPIFFMTFSWPQKNFNFHDFFRSVATLKDSCLCLSKNCARWQPRIFWRLFQKLTRRGGAVKLIESGGGGEV
mgnify:CR=1 FL=1